MNQALKKVEERKKTKTMHAHTQKMKTHNNCYFLLLLHMSVNKSIFISMKCAHDKHE